MQTGRFLSGARWRLEDVLPGHEGPGFEKVRRELEERTRQFESIRQDLEGFTRREVENALELYSKIQEAVSRIEGYAYMHFSEDVKNQRAKAFLDRAEEMQAEIENRTLFFRLWWVHLPDERAEQLTPQNDDYRHYLASLRKLREHTLEESVEQAVNLKNTTGFFGWSHHYDHLTSRFTFELKFGKRSRKLLTSDVVKLFSSSDGRKRVNAYRELLAKYGENGDVLGDVYRTVVRDWKNEFVRLRNYRTPISARNMQNDISDSSVEALLATCRKNAGLFRKFFRLKGKMLGIRRMSRYHVYAPVERKERRIDYETAVNQVLGSFFEFDQKFGELAKRVFDEGHVDPEARSGKLSGAYCHTVSPRIVPYLFLNFTGSKRDMYTIAHESGHAVHSQLASGHSILTFHPQLVMAETASVFGEMILFDKTLQKEDEESRSAMIVDKVTSMYSTICRQAYFAIFEMDAHAAVDEGATVDELCSTYLSNVKEQFEPEVDVPDEFRWEWTYIPHIYHTPFYCYAYAFGNLLTLALYDRYTKEGKSFVPSYTGLLARGGSASPGKMLEDLGFDIESTSFWQAGFDVISRMISKLE